MGTTIILGHGPSLRSAGRGHDISLFDNIIKFSHGLRWQSPRNYARRVDYLLVSQQNLADIAIQHSQAKDNWIWTRPGWWDEEMIERRCGPYPYTICKETDKWAQRFKDLGATKFVSERDPNPIFSSGVAALIISCEQLKAPSVVMAGFDDFVNGNQDGKHDIDVEKRLIEEIMHHYNMEVLFWT
jgi:hypothetical protein